MPDVSQQTQKLIQRYQSWLQSSQAKEKVATIHVDEVASKVAAIYEKVKGVIDWREEHLLRRAAIERVLRRKMFLRIGQKVEAQPMVLEIIRGGHFPNDKIEESKIPDIQKMLDKYIFIIENSPQPKKEKNKIQLQNWLLGLAACEVEEILDPQRKERALIDYMTELMRERIQTPTLSDEEKNTQVFIAVQRALFKLDSPIISYHIIKRNYSQWENISTEALAQFTQNIYTLWNAIEKNLNHHLAGKFYAICERYDTPYLIFGDILSQDPMTIQDKLNNPENFESSIRNAYKTRMGKLKSRLSRAAVYTTISIFITKMLLAFAVEFPYDKYITQEFNFVNIAINIIIPPLLMFILVLGTKPPRKENLEKVILETMKIVYEKDKKDSYTVRPSRKRTIVLKSILFIFYLVTFIGVFWLIWKGLDQLHFTWLSKLIFIVFCSLISFAGTKLRERAKELSVEEDRQGFFSFIMDWLSLPFIQLGKWLSNQWSRYNIIIVMTVALVDLPFQVFIEFLEQWRYFVKEKKEEIK